MTFVSKLALAAVLTLGSTALSVTPAAAQKKDDKGQGGPQLKVSEEFRKAAAAAEVSVKASDWAGAEPNLAAAEALAKTDDEKYFAAFLRLKVAANQRNEAGQIAALGVLVANPRTPPESLPIYKQVYYYMLGSSSMAAKKYPQAIDQLLQARAAGSKEADVPILLANAYAQTGKNAEVIVEVDRAIALSKAAGRKPPEDWYKFAIPKVNATGDRAAMATWLSRFITEYPTVKNWNWAVAVYRTTSPAGANTKVEKLDSYRLLRATNALANRGDYADYAYSAQQAGLPWESIAVIDEGRKNGRIPAGDADVGRIYTASQAGTKAEGSLEGLAKAAKDGKALASTADAFLASGNYARAAELYGQALAKGGVSADEVNLHRGIAFQRLGDKAQARTAFTAVQPGPLANMATLYITSLDLPPLS
jgi:predicted Zn-dependent protease